MICDTPRTAPAAPPPLATLAACLPLDMTRMAAASAEVAVKDEPLDLDTRNQRNGSPDRSDTVFGKSCYSVCAGPGRCCRTVYSVSLGMCTGFL